MPAPLDDHTEWLEPDGLGGFASGTATGIRTRRYQALLLAATTPPTGRFSLVNGVEVWLDHGGGTVPLSSQRYVPGVIHPQGVRWLRRFAPEPWPTWVYRLDDDTEIAFEVTVPKDQSRVVLLWRLLGETRPARLNVRPLLSGRDYHHLHRENPLFRFDADISGDAVRWRPYPDVPGVIARSTGEYRHEPEWYRSFLYTEELVRGLEAVEDLGSPGLFRFDLSRGDAALLLSVEGMEPAAEQEASEPVRALVETLRDRELARRQSFPTRLERSADAYIVRRGAGKTIIAGYPWFSDWGRDTFISIRGLCLATGRLEEAGQILGEWAGSVSKGMLPNRFLDAAGSEAEFNSVDASLWYVVAVGEYLDALRSADRVVDPADEWLLRGAVEAIVEGYASGTRFNIHQDDDGLLAAGEHGVQLTWMDAKFDGWVVTPRIGKPVEIQALWASALAVASRFDPRWADQVGRVIRSFQERFWCGARGCLYDVVDENHRSGANDARIRPNQIFAIGGLPLTLLEGERAERVVRVVEERLLTPIGLRTLAPGEPGYISRYHGPLRERDAAYHQGTVWPWLMGPFVEAWVRIRGGTAAAKREARQRFLAPLLAHLDDAGLGHISEIADAEPPHTPRGCPFQAWSVAEALRLDRVVLAETEPRPAHARR